MPRVGIVGGGISGLALAYRLQQLLPNADITVLESQSRPGGTVGTLSRDGFRVETGPNTFLDNNPATWNLCQELGLGDRLIPASEAARRNRFLLLRGRLRKLPSGLISFLTSSVLSWRAKWALLSERSRPRAATPADESIDAFARRRTNDEIAETLVDAFVTGIHAGDPTLLSLPATFPLMAQMEREQGSVAKGFAARAKARRREARARGEQPRKGTRAWSFPEGLGVLIDALTQRLRQPVQLGVRVQRIEKTPSGWRLYNDQGTPREMDVVVLACPAYQQALLLSELDHELAEKVQGIAYNRVVVVALGYRRDQIAHPLDGFGYLSPGREKRDVLGVQWCSSTFSGRAPEGHVLLRALCGGWHRAEMVDWPDDRLLDTVRNELKIALGIDVPPIFQQIVRWDRAIPQYHLGHLDRVAWIEQRCQQHPGLFLGGNCYRGISLNDCVEQAGRLAQSIACVFPR